MFGDREEEWEGQREKRTGRKKPRPTQQWEDVGQVSFSLGPLPNCAGQLVAVTKRHRSFLKLART
jgi:hypothetical protein